MNEKPTPPPAGADKVAPRKPEPEDIRLARQDVTNAAEEHERAHVVYIVTGRKLQQAQERLNALLKKPRRE